MTNLSRGELAFRNVMQKYRNVINKYSNAHKKYLAAAKVVYNEYGVPVSNRAFRSTLPRQGKYVNLERRVNNPSTNAQRNFKRAIKNYTNAHQTRQSLFNAYTKAASNLRREYKIMNAKLYPGTKNFVLEGKFAR
jgi:hypothetical protein